MPSTVRVDFVVYPPPGYISGNQMLPAFCGLPAPEPLTVGEAWSGYTILSTNGVCDSQAGALEGYTFAETIGIHVAPCNGECGYKLSLNYSFTGMLNWGDSPCLRENAAVGLNAETDCSLELGTSFNFVGTWVINLLIAFGDVEPQPWSVDSDITMTVS